MCLKDYGVTREGAGRGVPECRGRLFFVLRERRLKTIVNRDLITGDEFVGFVSHADDLLKFLEHLGRHAFGESGSGVGRDAVTAVICDADGDVEKFFREGIEGAGSHDGFEVFPGALEKDGIMGDSFPKIIDVVGLAGGHDVVVDGFHFWVGVFVFDEAEGGHEILRGEKAAKKC